ncbi:MAG: NAD-dependent epimerase/dehydratase family protein [candidate division WOR-3 bacterium]|nr:NAD-dependent epimerase/dehydratase family protein [candidate division WOR-3 bacterium]MCX7836655.1 NAD-dependent epimerase/dehydratase family protein [candidate division WOR-3 bacterium]MDW8113704.1 NAD-dependent epimerase/dehydratase family protein [candidate division WOR-3 bacterium]
MFKKLNFSILYRLFADVLILTFSYSFVYFLSEQALPDFLSLYFLIVFHLFIFSLLGFYTYGRTYRGRYKFLLILSGSLFSLLTFLFIGNYFSLFSLKIKPLLFGCFLSILLLSFVRLFLLLSNYFIYLEKKRARIIKKPIERILVIGGAGYIGSVLIRKLLKLGYKVRILDNFLYGKESIKELYNNKSFEICEGDFRHINVLTEALEDCDALIHLGAIVGDPACSISDKLTIETNLLATKFIVQLAKSKNCQRLIFASTCSVYGASDKKFLTEESPTNPLSLYAKTKLDSEKVLLSEGKELITTILRFATCYGPSFRERYDLVVNLLVLKAVKEGKIPIYGGEQWRPFIHIDDLCEGIIKVLFAKEELVNNQIFNLGDTNENYQLKEIGKIIKDVCPEAELIIYPDSPDRRNYRVSFEKIKKTLSFYCQKKVIDGVFELVEKIKKKENYSDPQFFIYTSNYERIKITKKESYWLSLIKEEVL